MPNGFHAWPTHRHINAPYNFVPLSRWIFRPPWADIVSHDLPFREGISGSVKLVLTARTPILIGAPHEKNEVVRFFEIPGAGPAIPGSSLRGMIRNVIEIAAFGKMRLVDDKRLGVRDLTAGARPFYGEHVSKNHGHGAVGPFEPKTKAGWLTYDAQTHHWAITPCQFARVDFSELARYGRLISATASDRGRSDSAGEKYNNWGRRNLDVLFDVGALADHNHSLVHLGPNLVPKQLRYRKVTNLGSGSKHGTLVFTGQPGPNKHMEFVFFDQTPKCKPVADTVWRGFLDVHAETDEWQFWQRSGGPVPVFYLEGAGAITSLGLAMMYKLAYKKTIGETIATTHPDHGSDTVFDLPETVFGSLRENDTLNLKSRVSFEPAVARGKCEPLDEVRTILNGPKPTYYPNYVQQDANPNTWTLNGNGYKTYMADDAEIRGWKRYPTRPTAQPQALTPEQKETGVQVRLQPLKAGAQFVGQLRFFNLLPEELGALVWALTWGGDVNLRHSIGMGKPFGYGQVSIELTEPQLAPNDAATPTPLSLDDCRARFEACLDTAYRAQQDSIQPSQGWRESEQLAQLIAMANPSRTGEFPGQLRHMRLEPNEFVAAKKRENLRVLPPFTPFTARLESQMFVAGDFAQPQSVFNAGQVPGISDSERWLEVALLAIVKQHHNKPEEALRGRDLANKWQEIEDPSQKADVLALIKNRWIEAGTGWGDLNLTGAARKAFEIYSPTA